MKQRYTVRKHPAYGKQGYWCTWDRVENRVIRTYSHLSTVRSHCKYMNYQNKKEVSA